MIFPIVLVIAYLLGGIPFGYLLVKWKTGRDVRSVGSGNIGATNVLRTTGKATGIITLLLDIGKGAAAVWIAGMLTHGDIGAMSGAAVAVMLGHAFPVLLKFHGGKAVASFIGAFLYLTPLALAAALVVFFAVAWKSRYVSLGSICAAGCFPLAVWMIVHPPWPVLAAAAFAGIFVIWRHSENIARLRAGKEHAISFGGPRS